MHIGDHVGLTFWKSAPSDIKDRARASIRAVVKAHTPELVAAFYGAFLQNEESAPFLSHSVVHERLSHSLARWLERLIETDLEGDISEFAAFQTRIGEIHARIKIPNHLVLQGASLLKSRIAMQVAAQDIDRQTLSATIILLDELIDFSMCLMSEAYVTNARQRAQADEAFRHFALGQDISLERETQRTALMEWSQSILFGLLTSHERDDFRRLSASSFGLWVRHRAAVLFHGSPLMESIEQLIETIDNEVLPAVVDSHPRSPQTLLRLQERIEEIKFLLNDMFQAVSTVESGRDPLTRALNRRFLPSVLSREIALARSGDIALSVALVDVDHFKAINDTYGHAIGDVVLGHVAETLLTAVRASDFVFRYGGEEFLIIFSETGIREAQAVAERIRNQFATTPVQIPDHGPISPTVSIGVASFEGHPDYEYLVKAADAALYRAKSGGRNRVVVADQRKAA